MAYVEPLTTWLKQHTELALIMTFLIAFAESLAVIGSIVPGSVMMTMVGILAGSGVMRIDLTLVASMLGAIAGDVGSYFLGYILSDKLLHIWPFKTHPQWLQYGKDYFERHGGKSVFFGRFIGPLRSIIPVIAGMMRMGRVEFLIANFISAIFWSILYVGPGILIGTASAELSTERATRLFLFVFGLLFILWLASLSIKWLWRHIDQIIQEKLDQAWYQAKTIHPLNNILRYLSPPGETNHGNTMGCILLFFLFLSITSIAILWICSGTIFETIDAPVYFFLQTFRTHGFDVFFTVITLCLSPCPLIALFLGIVGMTVYHQDWRSLRYWLSIISCFTLIACLSFYLAPMPTENILSQQTSPLFSVMQLAIATTCVTFLMLKKMRYSKTAFIRTIRFILMGLLCLAGIAFLYLGDNWLSGIITAYSFGFTLALLHWLFYRRYSQKSTPAYSFIIPFFLLISTAICIVCLDFKSTFKQHMPSYQQYVLTYDAWWHQTRPLLPLYNSDRLGRPKNILNIQYLGDLNTLEKLLKSHGWQKNAHSLLQMFLSGNTTTSFNTQFYLNQKPFLEMTYKNQRGKPMLLLSLWRSNYHLLNHRQPIWIGSLHSYQKTLNPFFFALRDFQIQTKPILPEKSPENMLYMMQEKNL